MSLIFTDFQQCIWLGPTSCWKICEYQSHISGRLSCHAHPLPRMPPLHHTCPLHQACPPLPHIPPSPRMPPPSYAMHVPFAMYVSLCHAHPPLCDRMTDACENISFPQLLLRTVKISMLVLKHGLFLTKNEQIVCKLTKIEVWFVCLFFSLLRRLAYLRNIPLLLQARTNFCVCFINSQFLGSN